MKGYIMRIEQIGEGKTIAEAFADAKAKLGAPEDAEISQEIISDAKKKMFGLISEPAKVLVWYERPDPVVKPEKAAAPAAKPVQAKPEEKKNEVKTSEKAQEKKPAVKEEAAAKPAAEVKAPVLTELPVTDDDITANYIKNIVKNMGIADFTMTLTLNEDEKEYVYTVSCDEEGSLIGKKGETLDAIQYLVRLFVNKGLTEDKHRKVTVNAGNYREKRKAALTSLAAKKAEIVKKYGRPVPLEPMHPYERRIVHTAIQGIEGVTSRSTGTDDNRKVVIYLEEGYKPTHPDSGKGGYRGSSRGRDRSQGGRGYAKREPYQPSVTRAPRKDTAGSLYGKIELPSDKDE